MCDNELINRLIDPVHHNTPVGELRQIQIIGACVIPDGRGKKEWVGWQNTRQRFANANPYLLNKSLQRSRTIVGVAVYLKKDS